MNNQDKEVFEKWWGEYPMGWKISGELHKNMSDSWQAACEYKELEINAYVNHLKDFDDEIGRLQAENKKLKDALKNCLIMSPLDPFERGDMIREALKEEE